MVRYVNKTPFGCQYEEFRSSPIRETSDQSGGGVGGSGKGGIGGAGGEGGAGGIGGAGIGGQGSMNIRGEAAFSAAQINVEWNDIWIPIQLVWEQSISVSDASWSTSRISPPAACRPHASSSMCKRYARIATALNFSRSS